MLVSAGKESRGGIADFENGPHEIGEDPVLAGHGKRRMKRRMECRTRRHMNARLMVELRFKMVVKRSRACSGKDSSCCSE